MVSDEFLKRFAEEQKNTKYDKDIICPYCNHIQDNETKYNHVSYWGEDSEDEIHCESCGKKFLVVEMVERDFKTTTMEWVKKEDERIEARQNTTFGGT
jgi:DNA-directed RNA polymerase subunit RPC12/RpoP